MDVRYTEMKLEKNVFGDGERGFLEKSVEKAKEILIDIGE